MEKKINIKEIYPPAIEFFSEWAKLGKDEGMEKGHTPAVNFMIDKLQVQTSNPFSVLDFGCGNGWVVRKFNKRETCIIAMGVDGAEKMIKKANEKDPENHYICADILQWNPSHKFSIIHSMEVLYYLENPSRLVNIIYSKWLDKGGCFIFGIDHYAENTQSVN